MTDYTDRDIVKNRMVGAGLDISANWDESIDGKCAEITGDIDRMIGKARGCRDFTFVAPGTASARRYRGRGVALLPISDCVSISAVTVRATPNAAAVAVASSGYTTEPLTGTPIVALVRTDGVWARGSIIEVTAKWGYATALPLDVQRAATVEVIRSYLGDRAGNDDRIGMTPFGAVVTAKAFTSLLRQLVADYSYGGASLR